MHLKELIERHVGLSGLAGLNVNDLLESIGEAKVAEVTKSAKGASFAELVYEVNHYTNIFVTVFAIKPTRASNTASASTTTTSRVASPVSFTSFPSWFFYSTQLLDEQAICGSGIKYETDVFWVSLSKTFVASCDLDTIEGWANGVSTEDIIEGVDDKDEFLAKLRVLNISSLELRFVGSNAIVEREMFNAGVVLGESVSTLCHAVLQCISRAGADGIFVRDLKESFLKPKSFSLDAVIQSMRRQGLIVQFDNLEHKGKRSSRFLKKEEYETIEALMHVSYLREPQIVDVPPRKSILNVEDVVKCIYEWKNRRMAKRDVEYVLKKNFSTTRVVSILQSLRDGKILKEYRAMVDGKALQVVEMYDVPLHLHANHPIRANRTEGWHLCQVLKNAGAPGVPLGALAYAINMKQNRTRLELLTKTMERIGAVETSNNSTHHNVLTRVSLKEGYESCFLPSYLSKTNSNINRKSVRTLNPGFSIEQKERRMRLSKKIVDERKAVVDVNFVSLLYNAEVAEVKDASLISRMDKKVRVRMLKRLVEEESMKLTKRRIVFPSGVEQDVELVCLKTATQADEDAACAEFINEFVLSATQGMGELPVVEVELATRGVKSPSKGKKDKKDRPLFPAGDNQKSTLDNEDELSESPSQVQSLMITSHPNTNEAESTHLPKTEGEDNDFMDYTEDEDDDEDEMDDIDEEMQNTIAPVELSTAEKAAIARTPDDPDDMTYFLDGDTTCENIALRNKHFAEKKASMKRASANLLLPMKPPEELRIEPFFFKFCDREKTKATRVSMSVRYGYLKGGTMQRARLVHLFICNKIENELSMSEDDYANYVKENEISLPLFKRNSDGRSALGLGEINALHLTLSMPLRLALSVLGINSKITNCIELEEMLSLGENPPLCKCVNEVRKSILGRKCVSAMNRLATIFKLLASLQLVDFEVDQTVSTVRIMRSPSFEDTRHTSPPTLVFRMDSKAEREKYWKTLRYVCKDTPDELKSKAAGWDPMLYTATQSRSWHPFLDLEDFLSAHVIGSLRHRVPFDPWPTSTPNHSFSMRSSSPSILPLLPQQHETARSKSVHVEEMQNEEYADPDFGSGLGSSSIKEDEFFEGVASSSSQKDTRKSRNKSIVKEEERNLSEEIGVGDLQKQHVIQDIIQCRVKKLEPNMNAIGDKYMLSKQAVLKIWRAHVEANICDDTGMVSADMRNLAKKKPKRVKEKLNRKKWNETEDVCVILAGVIATKLGTNIEWSPFEKAYSSTLGQTVTPKHLSRRHARLTQRCGNFHTNRRLVSQLVEQNQFALAWEPEAIAVILKAIIDAVSQDKLTSVENLGEIPNTKKEFFAKYKVYRKESQTLTAQPIASYGNTFTSVSFPFEPSNDILRTASSHVLPATTQCRPPSKLSSVKLKVGRLHVLRMAAAHSVWVLYTRRRSQADVSSVMEKVSSMDYVEHGFQSLVNDDVLSCKSKKREAWKMASFYELSLRVQTITTVPWPIRFMDEASETLEEIIANHHIDDEDVSFGGTSIIMEMTGEDNLIPKIETNLPHVLETKQHTTKISYQVPRENTYEVDLAVKHLDLRATGLGIDAFEDKYMTPSSRKEIFSIHRKILDTAPLLRNNIDKFNGDSSLYEVARSIFDRITEAGERGLSGKVLLQLGGEKVAYEAVLIIQHACGILLDEGFIFRVPTQVSRRAGLLEDPTSSISMKADSNGKRREDLDNSSELDAKRSKSTIETDDGTCSSYNSFYPSFVRFTFVTHEHVKKWTTTAGIIPHVWTSVDTDDMHQAIFDRVCDVVLKKVASIPATPLDMLLSSLFPFAQVFDVFACLCFLHTIGSVKALVRRPVVPPGFEKDVHEAFTRKETALVAFDYPLHYYLGSFSDLVLEPTTTALSSFYMTTEI
eukprot:m.122954 g.122954  ORF g.122954 m.122954 type:complete len:1886 (+) comp9399_c0_seq1:9-5666(+)